MIRCVLGLKKVAYTINDAVSGDFVVFNFSRKKGVPNIENPLSAELAFI